MMRLWQRVRTKIDGLSLRERVIVFVLGAVVMITLVNSLYLDRQMALQKQLLDTMRQDETIVVAMRAEIQRHAALSAADPDEANRARLKQLRAQIDEMQGGLQETQRRLVSPAMMSVVLEDILKQNQKIRLISLRTLPPAGLLSRAPQSPGPSDKQKTEGGGQSEQKENAGEIFKHGVELKVEGTYADLAGYLKALETLKWQFFWGGARLEVVEYPKTTLTLTLYTLSLDHKWLNL